MISPIRSAKEAVYQLGKVLPWVAKAAELGAMSPQELEAYTKASEKAANVLDKFIQEG